MKRECIKLPTEKFQKYYPYLKNSPVEIYIDRENSKEILDYLTGREKKFKMIVFQILSLRYDDDLYGKEEVSDKAKNVTAMKFKMGKKENIRIYCKEFNVDGKKVVMITKKEKKTQKVNKTLKQLLEIIGGYEYDFK
ncbi:MAG TPA: hypothetical protein VHO03_07800 [Ignavibacteriales bacterium]|nr:hypothetical protein [Ignavibacteriales bacterium]